MKLAAVMMCSAMVSWAGVEFHARPGEQVVPNRYIVRLRSGAANLHAALTAAPGAQVQALAGGRLLTLTLPSSARAALVSAVASHMDVDYLEPDRIRHISLQAPNDTQYPSQWALTTVKALQAWSTIPNRYLTAATAGAGRVKVAVLDSGADCTHPDFINLGGSSTNSALGGQLNFVLSRAPVATTITSPACAWQDDVGHGTHTAGTVAAATGNGLGVSALGHPVELVIYKVLDSTGNGSDSVVADAIISAADAGAGVISMSLGGPGYSQAIQDAITYAWNKNAVVVSAAGNGSTSALTFPAGANFGIGVAASDGNNSRAGFSNFGDYVDIAAPGVSVLSTLPVYPNRYATNYGYLSGTSMATPHVAALAGLLWIASPGTTAAAITRRIQQSANGTGWTPQLGYGIMDAYAALTATASTSNAGAITGQVVDAWGLPISNATLAISGQTIANPESGLFRFPNLPAGNYTLTVSASGFSTKVSTVGVASGADTQIAVVMGISTGTLQGTLTTGGIAAAGMDVQAIDGTGAVRAGTVSAADGSFSLKVAAGTYTVRASGFYRVTATSAQQAVASGGTVTVNLSLPRMGSIAGVVRDSNSNPVAGALISVVSGNTTVGAQTDAFGNYATIGLPSGSYAVMASSGLSTASASSVSVAPDMVTTVNLQFVTVPGSPIAVYGTGVAAVAGVLLADGSVDGHYRLVSSPDASFPGPNAIVVNSNVFPIPPWPLNGPNSKWIAPQASQTVGNVPGVYTYRTTFDLTGFNPATAVLTGQWVCDDSAAMKLNGTVVSTVSTFGAWTAFTVNTGFVAGLNTIDFLVTNLGGGANPTGLRVDLSGQAATTAPGTIAVSVSPATASLSGGQTQQFTATVTGTANTAVNWSISPAGVGSIGAGGLYTAPAIVASTQTVQVTAQSQADLSKTGSATVTLNPPAPATAPIAVYGTGVAAVAGVLLADGSVDGHYRLVSSPDASFPGPNAVVVNSSAYPIPPWPLNGPNSKWIAPRASQAFGNAVGVYTYRTTFDLTGFNPATAVLTGQWVCDDSAAMKLNGTLVSTVSTFGAWTGFTVNTGFVAGVNTIDFLVTNLGGGANPTGLRVDLSGQAATTAPGTVAVSVSPATASLSGGQTQQFTATVTGTANTAVNWSISPAGVGSIGAGGLYTAPAIVASTQTVQVTAQSQADLSKTGSATVTLNPPAPATAPIAVYGTGVAAVAGVLLADGSVDGHYRLVSSPDASFPGPNAVVVNSSAYPIPPWPLNGPNSKWIAPRASQTVGNVPGVYTYRTTFDLTGFNPATAVLTGQWVCDDSAAMKLNGTLVSTVSTFGAWTSFTVNTGFVAGLNTIDFLVTNLGGGANPTGLRVDLSGQAAPTAPGTIAVSVSPAIASLSGGQTQQFTATVTGTANTAVNWSISPAGVGSIGAGGLYTAPAIVASTQTVQVTAQSQADLSKTGSATVTLNPPAPATAPIAVYGTGVAAVAGVLLADGSVDGHYRLVSSADPSFPGPNAIVVNSSAYPIPPWPLNGPNSKWIAPRASQTVGNVPGVYTYRTTFDLTGFNPATAVLTGQWVCDDSAAMKLNGTLVSTVSTFGAWTSFTVNTGFVAGVNTIDFLVTNLGGGANPTGLRVDLSGQAVTGP